MAGLLLVEHLEAGVQFGTWAFRYYTAPTKDLWRFFSDFDVSLDEVKLMCKQDGLERFSIWFYQRVSPDRRQAIRWFELGQNTAIIGEMASSGMPFLNTDTAILKNLTCLTNVGIEGQERIVIESQTRELFFCSKQTIKSNFAQLLRRLERQALMVDMARRSTGPDHRKTISEQG